MEVLKGFNEEFDEAGNCTVWSWSHNGVILWKREYFDYDAKGRPGYEKHYERFSKNGELELIREKKFYYDCSDVSHELPAL